MSPLALAIYAVLRTLVPSRGDSRVSYSDLLSRLPEQLAHLDLEDPAHRNDLSEALGEIVLACRAAGLPALSALVVRLDGGELGYPGPGYYGLAHPEAAGELEQLAAWGRELEAAKGATYPERLDGDPPAAAPPAASPASPNCVALADEFARRLEAEIQGLPDGFLDTFAYTTTGNNLAHPVILGTVVRIAWGLPGVRFVAVDLRVNLGGGVKFQPDVAALDANLNYLFFADYESPNSSDARIPTKDVDAYVAWRQKTGLGVPYLILTTLPDRESPSWELRWASAGCYNEAFQGRWQDVAANPFRFWHCHYLTEFAARKMDGVALVNLDGKKATRTFPA